jgi:hypothetical protein
VVCAGELEGTDQTLVFSVAVRRGYDCVINDEMRYVYYASVFT